MESSALPVNVTAQIFASGKYSDLTITCQGREFKVHRNVVCLQSTVIATKVDEILQSGSPATLDLPDNDPDVVERMVYFFYHGEYPGTTQKTEPLASPTTETPESSILLVSEVDGSVLRKKNKKKKKNGLVNGVGGAADKTVSITESASILHAHVHAIAQKYVVPALIAYAAQRYEDAILAWSIVDFVESLKIIYKDAKSSEGNLKDVAVKVAAEHTSDLCETAEFATLCKENGEVAFDVLKASLVKSTDSAKDLEVKGINGSLDETLLDSGN